MLLAQDEVQQVFSGPQPGESMEAFDVLRDLSRRASDEAEH